MDHKEIIEVWPFVEDHLNILEFLFTLKILD